MADSADGGRMDFVTANLPPAPARVLDAGCGNGELADTLRANGYDVTAIDVDPALARPGVRVADICTFRDRPYDAIVFAFSLHHVSCLHDALDAAHALLKPTGRLVVDEFAHERADDTIADRYYQAPGSLARWREEHEDLHTGTAMVAAIALRFTITSLARVPYLHRCPDGPAAHSFESDIGLQLTATPALVPHTPSQERPPQEEVQGS